MSISPAEHMEHSWVRNLQDGWSHHYQSVKEDNQYNILTEPERVRYNYERNSCIVRATDETELYSIIRRGRTNKKLHEYNEWNTCRMMRQRSCWRTVIGSGRCLDGRDQCDLTIADEPWRPLMDLVIGVHERWWSVSGVVMGTDEPRQALRRGAWCRRKPRSLVTCAGQTFSSVDGRGDGGFCRTLRSVDGHAQWCWLGDHGYRWVLRSAPKRGLVCWWGSDQRGYWLWRVLRSSDDRGWSLMPTGETDVNANTDANICSYVTDVVRDAVDVGRPSWRGQECGGRLVGHRWPSLDYSYWSWMLNRAAMGLAMWSLITWWLLRWMIILDVVRVTNKNRMVPSSEVNCAVFGEVRFSNVVEEAETETLMVFWHQLTAWRWESVIKYLVIHAEPGKLVSLKHPPRT